MFIGLLQTVITIKVLNLLLLWFDYVTHNVTWFHTINCYLDTMC